MERGVEDPPVLHPFLALVVGHTVGEQLGQRRELGLLEVAELVGHDVPRQGRVGDGHPGHRAEPREAHAAVLPDGAVDERRDTGGDVVAPQRQGPGPGLPVGPAVLLEVAGEEAVRRAAEALRAQRPLEAPRPPPQPLQQPGGLPQEQGAQEAADEEAPWRRGDLTCQRPKNHFPQLSSEAGEDRVMTEWWDFDLMMVG
jgi:hypothetical protein